MPSSVATDPRTGRDPSRIRERNLLDRITRREHPRGVLPVPRETRASCCFTVGSRWPAARCCQWGAAGTPVATCSPRPRFASPGSTPILRGSLRCSSTGRADAAFVGAAGALELPDHSFDVVLYRLVLHHIVFQGPLAPCFTEAARLLRPGGALVAIEPGLWHPVGAALALANRAGLAEAIHGTPDDVPSRRVRLATEARSAGLEPELHAVTYTWRRLPRLSSVLRAPDGCRIAPPGRPLRPHTDADRPCALRITSTGAPAPDEGSALLRSAPCRLSPRPPGPPSRDRTGRQSGHARGSESRATPSSGWFSPPRWRSSPS